MMIFDEYEHAEKMLKNGFLQSTMKLRELQILANYFRYAGMEDKAIEENLHVFLNKYMANYNKVKFQNIVDNAVKTSKKQKIKKASEIIITKNEWNTIMSEPNERVQKLLFTYLCLGKYFKSNNDKTDKYYVGVKDADLWKISKLHLRKIDRLKLLSNITQKGYITPTLNMSSIVNFIEGDGEEFLKFKPCENMLYYYEKQIGARIIFCRVCGDIEKANANAQKYCKKCAKAVKNGVIPKP